MDFSPSHLPPGIFGGLPSAEDNLLIATVHVVLLARLGGPGAAAHVRPDRFLQGLDPAPNGGAAFRLLAEVAGHLAGEGAGGGAALELGALAGGLGRDGPVDGNLLEAAVPVRREGVGDVVDRVRRVDFIVGRLGRLGVGNTNETV